MRKLKRPSSHRKSLLRNLATSLLLHEKINTTYQKAKELSRFVEKLITIAKENNLTARRRISREIKNKFVYRKLFDVLVPRYKEKPGGYTQVFRLKWRKGDSAEIAIIKLT